MDAQTEKSRIGNKRVLRDPSSSIEATFIDYGATLTHLLVPDRQGKLKDVVLGCPEIQDYIKPHPFFNCLVGRYSNRITNAEFTLEGQKYVLEANMGKHHIHGGYRGFANRTWQSEETTDAIEFSLVSSDGDQGYPGELSVQALYSLQSNTLKLEFWATTTRPTPISMTAHHYFNLSGIQASSIRNHELRVNADHYTVANPDLTQRGEFKSVARTPFDFRQSKCLGEQNVLDSTDPQVQSANGIDHNYVLNGSDLRTAAILKDPISGRCLTVRTNQPCMQVYTANTLDAKGKDNTHYSKHQAICLETQQFPDSLNHSAFPDSVLDPGETFYATTEYEFSVED